MKKLNEILCDANIADSGKKVAFAQMLQQTNPTRSYTGEGYGIKLCNNGHQSNALPHLDSPFIADSMAEAKQFAMALDADTVGFDITSSGAPQALTSIFTSMMIRQLLQTTPFSKITQSFQNGSFGVTNTFIPSMSARGVSNIYGDRSVSGATNVNVNWMSRDVVYLQRSLSYADLEIAQMSLAKVDIVNGIRSFNSELIAIDINNIGFSGYAGMRVFGLLNDPSLNPTLISPASVAVPASSQWIYKTYLEISADIQALYAQIIANAGGQADYTTPAYLVVAPAVYVYLTKQNALGTQSVMEYIKSTFSGLEVVQAQNVQGTAAPGQPIGSATPNYAMLLFKELGGQPVALNSFVTPYYSHGVIRLEDYYAEKISFAVSGAFVTRALGISLMSGV
jgi:hypothetical protein